MSKSMIDNLHELYFDRIEVKSPFNWNLLQTKYGISSNFIITENIDIPPDFNNVKQLVVGTINGSNINNIIKSINFFDITTIKNENQLKKLHLLYSIFITLFNHYNSEKKIVPYNLSIPILYLFKKLNMPPIMTYSDIILNNVKINNTNNKKNMEIDFTFTKLPTEKKYYTILLRIELSASQILNNILNIFKNITDGKNSDTNFKNISQNLKDYINWISNINNDEKNELKKVFEYYKYNDLFHYFGEKYVIEELEGPYNFYNITISQSPLIQILNIFLVKNSVHIKNSRPYCYREHQLLILDFENYMIQNNISEYLLIHYNELYSECQSLFERFLNEFVSLYLP